MRKRQGNGARRAIRRLVFGGDVKGSAGKSFFQSHLVEALCQWGVRVRGYDPDTSFHRMEAMCGAQRVTRLDFEDAVRRSVPVIDLVEDRYDVAVILGGCVAMGEPKEDFFAGCFCSLINVC